MVTNADTPSGAVRAALRGYGWVRLLPTAGALGFLALLHIPGYGPTAWDWPLALVSAALVPVGGRFPVAVAVAQSVLFAAAAAPDVQLASGVVRILACTALGELALRRSGAPTWWGAGLTGVASAVNFFPGYPLAGNVLVVLLNVGLPLLLGSFIRSQRQLAEQAEQRAAEAERSRALAATAARAAERAAVARELHDVVAHHVASIVLRVGVVRHVVPSVDPRIDEALADVHGIGGQALADLRRLVAVLRDPNTVGEPALLSATGLSTALSDVVERTRQAGVRVDTAVDPHTVERLGTAHRHAVLRLIQEGLTNVLKHAGHGVRARVVLDGDGHGGVRVEVSDDGGGSGPPREAEPGHGLLVMRERVELLGGSLEAGPVPGPGERPSAAGPRPDSPDAAASSGSGGWALRAVLPEPQPALAGTSPDGAGGPHGTEAVPEDVRENAPQNSREDVPENARRDVPENSPYRAACSEVPCHEGDFGARRSPAAEGAR